MAKLQEIDDWFVATLLRGRIAFFFISNELRSPLPHFRDEKAQVRRSFPAKSIQPRDSTNRGTTAACNALSYHILPYVLHYMNVLGRRRHRYAAERTDKASTIVA